MNTAQTDTQASAFVPPAPAVKPVPEATEAWQHIDRADMSPEEREKETQKVVDDSLAHDTLTMLIDELACLRARQPLGLGYYHRVKMLFDLTMHSSISAYEGYSDVFSDDLGSVFGSAQGLHNEKNRIPSTV